MGEPVMRRLLILVALAGGTARAEEPARKAGQGPEAACTVRVVHARSQAGEVDGRLGPLKAQLAKPPLSSWRSFKLLGQHELRLQADAAAPFAVPGDHEGALQFLGRVEGQKARLRMRLEIKDGRAKLLSTVFVVDNGGTVLHGGIKYLDGVLVTGITCRL